MDTIYTPDRATATVIRNISRVIAKPQIAIVKPLSQRENTISSIEFYRSLTVPTQATPAFPTFRWLRFHVVACHVHVGDPTA